MINIIRSDGFALVISSARGLVDTPKGLIVDFGSDDMYIVKHFNLEDLNRWTVGYYSNLININAEWKAFPDE